MPFSIQPRSRAVVLVAVFFLTAFGAFVGGCVGKQTMPPTAGATAARPGPANAPDKEVMPGGGPPPGGSK